MTRRQWHRDAAIGYGFAAMNGTDVSLIEELQATQRRMTALLDSVSEDQDWRPGSEQWSFRSIAAHMATVEEECYVDRIERIGAGGNPHFESYFNTDRNFSRCELRESVHRWIETRCALFDLLRTFPEAAWSFTGTHARFGTVGLTDVLRLMLDHDRQHIDRLEQLVAQRARKEREA